MALPRLLWSHLVWEHPRPLLLLLLPATKGPRATQKRQRAQAEAARVHTLSLWRHRRVPFCH